MRTLALLLLLTLPLFADRSNEFFQRGNRFYQANEFDSAAAVYDSALATGATEPALLSNRAAAAYRKGDLGTARFFYERAALRAPQDEEIAKSIAYLKTQQIDKEFEHEESLITKGLRLLHELVPLSVQLYALVGLSILFVGMVGMILFKKGMGRQWSIYLAGALLLAMVTVASSAGVKVYRSESYREAVILAETAAALNQPGGATTIFSIHEGAKVELLRRNDQWAQIALPDGTAGWVRLESIGVIE